MKIWSTLEQNLLFKQNLSKGKALETIFDADTEAPSVVVIPDTESEYVNRILR